MPRNELATQNQSAAREIIGCLDMQCTRSLLGELHAAGQLAAFCGIPGIILSTVNQHALGGNLPDQSHRTSAFITEHNSDTILIFVINLILFPIEGGGVPLAIISFIGPGGGH